ncbi:hypothetical protein VUR80DRAFT_8003 [Thermomyces stellatus]
MSSTSFISADTEYFKSTPWCNDLISSPYLVLFTPTCRQPESNETGASRDQFFRKSLNHDNAIPHCIGLYHDPTKTPNGGRSAPEPSREDPELYVKSASLLCDLRPGLNSYNGTAHGGLIATLVDESMGSLILVNHITQAALEEKGHKLPEGTLDLNNTRVLTANMTVRFQKPLPTPSIALVTTTFVKTKGRKLFFDVRVTGEGGREYAQCDGLWISMPLQKI